MIRGGNATILVTDLDRAIRFYTEALGLRVRFRAGDEWAEIDAGDGLVLGLQAVPPRGPRAGRAGSISVALHVTAPLEQVVAALRERGVPFRGPIRDEPDEPVRLAFLRDPDGNDLCLCEVKDGPGTPAA